MLVVWEFQSTKYLSMPKEGTEISVIDDIGTVAQQTNSEEDILVIEVRIENIVFGSNGPGVLIDFDLCREINTRYQRYNASIPTRHPRAYCGQLMQPEHDRYSLAVVLTPFVQHGDTATPASLVARLQS
jgi:hypothetical protein